MFLDDKSEVNRYTIDYPMQIETGWILKLIDEKHGVEV